MRKIIVMLGLLGGFIFLGSIDANAAECIGYNRMTGRCVTAQEPRCGRQATLVQVSTEPDLLPLLIGSWRGPVDLMSE
jgi:hypothetical protein